MKFFQVTTLLFAILLLTNCNKEEPFELTFGEPQYGFILDSVYMAETNGMLYVQFEANSNAAYLRVLADNSKTPATEISKLSAWGPTTLAISKGTYWIVEKHPDYQPSNLPVTDTLITWTPIY